MNSPAMPPLSGADPVSFPPVEAGLFRDAMARLGAAVNIITTDGPGGRAGFAATAVCSVTDTPPTLLVCLNRSSSVVGAFTANPHLCVNTLSAGHRDLSSLFGGKTPMAERFAAAQWHAGLTGVPVLADSLVAFECRLSHSVEIGTHRVLFCEVLAIAGGGAEEALIYFGRRYHTAAALG